MKDPIFKPKFFSLLKNGISKKQLAKDLSAGFIVGIVALPLAIAFAIASAMLTAPLPVGLTPERSKLPLLVG